LLWWIMAHFLRSIGEGELADTARRLSVWQPFRNRPGPLQ